MADQAADDATGQADRSDIKVEFAGPAGEVLVLRLDAPLQNALLPGLRQQLMQLLNSPQAARPIVITGSERGFSAATLIEAGSELYTGTPSLAALCRQIEDHPFPVVAALSGRVTGPGAELALAAHGRVAGPKMRLTFPEIGLGLSPVAGASQRLPRLVGVAETIRLLIDAETLGPEAALAIGLVDHIVEGDPVSAAIALALQPEPPLPAPERRDGLAAIAANQAALAAARLAHAANPLPAPARVLEAIEAALYLPIENGYLLEAVLHEDLQATPESHGLIAAAKAERLASPLLRGTAAPVQVLGLNGSSAAQAGLAMLALGRGIAVIWCDADQTRHAEMLHWVEDRLRSEAKAGRISATELDADLQRLQRDATPEALANADLVIHASPLDHQGFAEASPAPQLVIGTQSVAGRAGLVLHPSGRGAELGWVERLSPEDLAQVVQLLRQLGLPPVLVDAAPLIGRRVFAAGRAALHRLAQSGVALTHLSDSLAAFGQLAPDITDPGLSMTPRLLPQAEIRNRWLLAMAAEGLRLIQNGATALPALIDHVMVTGYGFPRWQGGPMYQADARGMMVLRADLRRWQPEGEVWAVPEILDRLIAESLRLSDLNAG